MSDAERAEKLRYLEARPLEWMRFMFYKFAKYEFAEFQKKAIRRIMATATATGTRCCPGRANWLRVPSS